MFVFPKVLYPYTSISLKMKRILRSNKVGSPSPPVTPSSSDEFNSSIQEVEYCRPSECIKDKKRDRFICTECKRSVHYACTELPAYYIQLIVGKDIKFICVNCVNITKKISDNYPSPHEQIKSQVTEERCH